MSLYRPSSNFRFLSQGVAAAIQKRHFSVDAGGVMAGPDAALAGIPTTPRAAAAPKVSKNVLRVVSMIHPLAFDCGSLRQAVGKMQSLQRRVPIFRVFCEGVLVSTS